MVKLLCAFYAFCFYVSKLKELKVKSAFFSFAFPLTRGVLYSLRRQCLLLAAHLCGLYHTVFLELCFPHCVMDLNDVVPVLPQVCLGPLTDRGSCLGVSEGADSACCAGRPAAPPGSFILEDSFICASDQCQAILTQLPFRFP